MINRLPMINHQFLGHRKAYEQHNKVRHGNSEKIPSETAARSEVWESSSKAAEFLASEFEDVLL